MREKRAKEGRRSKKARAPAIDIAIPLLFNSLGVWDFG